MKDRGVCELEPERQLILIANGSDAPKQHAWTDFSLQIARRACAQASCSNIALTSPVSEVPMTPVSEARKHFYVVFSSLVTSRSFTATSDPPVANRSLVQFEIKDAARCLIASDHGCYG